MIRASLFACLMVSLALVGGCARYSLVKANQEVTIDGVYKVSPPIKWSKASSGDLELWTVNGSALDQVIFYKGIESGDPLVEGVGSGDNDEERPVFDSRMTSLELLDLFVATKETTGWYNLETTNLRPWKFGALDGFRFEYSFALEDGLEQKGFAVGMTKDEKLYLITFTAASLYYYDRYEDAAEGIVSSIEVI
ncbi:MAG: hypothetical protein QNI93_21705 [Kiloniellales bacterium]|nr:hypothetical protein [Kiloniellales bacterium]